MYPKAVLRRFRGPALLIFVLLAIEFLDEFVFGAREAAWPLIRDDLHLTYYQIGLLLSVPSVIASLIEPVLGILGDIGRRRVIMLGGGIGFGLACLLIVISHSFLPLMFAFILIYPSSGAFVALSQSTLMDQNPARHEHSMARWTFAGSAGMLCGSLALGAAAWSGLGWRSVLIVAFGMTVALWLMLSRFPIENPAFEALDGSEEAPGFVDALRNALSALRRPEVLRWLTLLPFSNLMVDILYGYLALYFVDVVRTNQEQATLAIAAWTGVGLLGDFLLIPLIERVEGLAYLRISAAIEFVLFPAFLLVPGLIPKVIILALLGFFNAGWYSILQGQLYSAMPGQSGSVITVGTAFELLGSLLPFAIGLAAERFGLGT